MCCGKLFRDIKLCTLSAADSEKISDYPPPASPVDEPDDGAPGDVAPEAPAGETDDENTVSNKTSMESVEANNNNTIITARVASTTPRGWYSSISATTSVYVCLSDRLG
jgi:hypothetical protein